MPRPLIVLTAGLVLCLALGLRAGDAEGLRVGFGETDITPELGKKPVYLAGFGKNRAATKVHDPIMTRAVVLAHGRKKVALVSVDVVGLFLEPVELARQRLPGFSYVLVSSTHNHEGPDTLGLWGPSAFQSGVDPAYLKKVEDGIVAAVQQAERGLADVHATRIGTAKAPELLHDSREPYVLHDELVALQFLGKRGENLGVVVQWNNHPETLSSKNTEVSADYVGYTVSWLKKRYECPAVYLTGTVGGLMTSLRVEVKDASGKPLADGTFEKTQLYGERVGQLGERALKDGKPIELTPFEVRTKQVFLPLHNPLYRLGWKLGVLDRPAYVWTGDPSKAEPAGKNPAEGQMLAIRTEVGWLKLGELEVAAIPGEIYPELVLGKVQDPSDPAADFPDAPVEPSVYGQMKSPHRMIVGLANDELGYILPKRQWDAKAPFCYGRKRAQYGEENSVGPEAGPILCATFRELAAR